MPIAKAYVALLLAPFGGEARLLARAELLTGPPGAVFRVYSADDGLSNGGPADREDAVAVSLLFRGGGRPQRLRAALARVRAGGWILVLDHNAPRRPPVRLLALFHLVLGWPLLRRTAPGSRLQHPVARELQDLGLEVVSLRLVGAEFFQAVLARSPG